MSIKSFGSSRKGGVGRSGGSNNYKGIFADTPAVEAIPKPKEGEYATNQTSGTIWYYDGTSWADSGSNTSGDMLSGVYDPGNVSSDVFSTDNHISGVTTRVFTTANQSKLGILQEHWRGTVADATARDALPNQLDGDEVYQTDTASVWKLASGVWGESGGATPVSRVLDNNSTAGDSIALEGDTIIIGPQQGGSGHINMTVNATANSFTILDANSQLTSAYHLKITFGVGDSLQIGNAGDHILLSKGEDGSWTYLNYRTGLGGAI